MLCIAVAALAKSQSAVTVSEVVAGHETAYFTQHTRLGEPGVAMSFRLSFEPFAQSTIAADNSGNSVWWTATNSTYSDRLILPRTKFNATFVAGEEATLAVFQLTGGGGASYCNKRLHIGAQPHACRSPTWASTACNETGCWYAGQHADNSFAMFRLDMTNAVDPFVASCFTKIKVHTSTGWVEACATAQHTFNPIVHTFGSSVHFGPDNRQTLYFGDKQSADIEGAVFALVITIILVGWISCVNDFINGYPTTTALKSTAMGMTDAVITTSVASILAITRSGDAFCPIETSLALGHNAGKIAVGLYMVVTLYGAVLVLALALSTVIATLVGEPACPIAPRGLSPVRKRAAIVSRVVFETVLLCTLFFHLPTTMGIDTRRTIGSFAGIAICFFIGRDIPAAPPTPRGVIRGFVGLWAAAAYMFATLAMVLPPVYISAGITNDSALAVSFVLSASAVAAGAAVTT